MVSDKYTRIQYDKMKSMHDDLINKILDLEKELKQLRICYNHLTTKYDDCKKRNENQEQLLSNIFKVAYNKDTKDIKISKIKNILLGVDVDD